MWVADGDRRCVEDILRHWLPVDVGVYAYGSRAHGRNVKPFSDLDLCLKGPNVVPGDGILELRSAFEDSDLPFTVDIVDWSLLRAEFRTAIAPDLVLMYGPDTLAAERNMLARS